MTPRVSIVVNTLNRAESLRRTLLSLRQLGYPEFEVVVVVGPSSDHTDTVVRDFADVKVGYCAEPNLSMSRNLGVGLASGELVAFIDDDAVPDPWWLDDVVPVFEDSEVAAAGGPVYDSNGAKLFARYSLTDLHGDASVRIEGPNPSKLLAAPLSDRIVYPIGTNSIFRRNTLIAIGGFDEEFEYFLDESDVCRRLVDSGWVVQACDHGWVYHFRGPSAIRTSELVTHDLYPVLKSRFYFALRHARPRVGLNEVLSRYNVAVEVFRSGQLRHLENSLLQVGAIEKFESDAIRAADEALESALREPRLRAPSWFSEQSSSFVAFRRSLPARRLHVCIVTREYLPKQLNGIGRLSHELAGALAKRGHVVRILTEAEDDDTVDFNDGVWVHRVVVRPETPPEGIEAPPTIWGFSASVLAELHRIAEQHSVDVVQVPNWNSEGIAIIEDGGYVSVLGLHTPLKTIARIDSRFDPKAPEVQRLLALERRCYEQATGFLACGPASLNQIEDEYGIELRREQVGFVPFGISDRRNVDPLRVAGRVNVLFVGRLEARKGIDILLEAAGLLLAEMPEVAFVIVGNDAVASESGRTYREGFERATDAALRDGRVFFHGVVPDEDLDRYYAGCDVFVAPSRSESFGLILLEAMRAGKPVIAGDVGGMREVVEHGGNGLLVPIGDAHALAAALRRLVRAPALRERYGRRSRELFTERFTSARMAEDYERFCMELLDSGMTAKLDPARRC